jgi:hypothetical protein
VDEFPAVRAENLGLGRCDKKIISNMVRYSVTQLENSLKMEGVHQSPGGGRGTTDSGG